MMKDIITAIVEYYEKLSPSIALEGIASSTISATIGSTMVEPKGFSS